MPFRYLIGLPLGSWIMRKAIEPSVEVAGKSLTGTRTRDRRRLPDQTGMGAIGDTRERYGLSRIWGDRRRSQVNKGGPRRRILWPYARASFACRLALGQRHDYLRLADRGKVASNDTQRRMFLRSGSVGGHRRTRGYGLLSLPFMPFVVGRTGQRLLALEA